MLLGSLLIAEPTAGIGKLDQENGFGGIAFGESDSQVSGLKPVAGGIGKRWQITKLFARPADTATIAGRQVYATYWFRNHRFVGVTIRIAKNQGEATAAWLHRQYGAARRDSIAAGTEYWLGKRTYILLEPVYPKSQGWELHVASLAMLNEQVAETAVRQQARLSLGWRPDSLGLPRQYPR